MSHSFNEILSCYQSNEDFKETVRIMGVSLGTVYRVVREYKNTGKMYALNNYTDTGCELYPRCLECPREICIYDEKREEISRKGIDIILSSEYNKSMTIEKQQCLRCGYEWYPKQPELPKRCARCRSPYWNKPKWKQSGPHRK